MGDGSFPPPQKSKKTCGFHSFGVGWGGACLPPPPKIKEITWISIVLEWGGGGRGPPHPQNQRKETDFHSFGVGTGASPHIQNQRKHIDFHSFGGGRRVHPPPPKIRENHWFFMVLEWGWGGAGGPPHSQNYRKPWISII